MEEYVEYQVEVSDETYERLQERSRQTGKSPSELAREYILRGLERLRGS